MLVRYALALEKSLIVLKPWPASGLGCTLHRIKCLVLSTYMAFSCAFLPQSIKTTPSVSLEIVLITCYVRSSHPFFWCELDFPNLTVRIAFKRNTP